MHESIHVYESVMHGQYNIRPRVSYLPDCRASPPFDRYQIILLGEQRNVCKQPAQGCYLL